MVQRSYSVLFISLVYIRKFWIPIHSIYEKKLTNDYICSSSKTLSVLSKTLFTLISTKIEAGQHLWVMKHRL